LQVFKNAHWEISNDWIASTSSLPTYEFSIDRVFKEIRRKGKTLYDWPILMAEKIWVDVGLFNEAFEKAIRHHSQVTGTPIDESMLEESFAESYRVAGMGIGSD
jgi:hypothetical protein